MCTEGTQLQYGFVSLGHLPWKVKVRDKIPYVSTLTQIKMFLYLIQSVTVDHQYYTVVLGPKLIDLANI